MPRHPDIDPYPATQASRNRRMLRSTTYPDQLREEAFRRAILAIPAGKVSTYGKVATAAGYPLYHRAVARLLRTDPPDLLPWHRVVGAGGMIKLRHDGHEEQRLRLEMEGVPVHNGRVAMDQHEHTFQLWAEPQVRQERIERE